MTQKNDSKTVLSSCCASVTYEQRQAEHMGIYCLRCGKWQRWVRQEASFEDAAKFVMPFGKHKGRLLVDLPEDYLAWIAGEFEDKRIGKLAELVLSAHADAKDPDGRPRE